MVRVYVCGESGCESEEREDFQEVQCRRDGPTANQRRSSPLSFSSPPVVCAPTHPSHPPPRTHHKHSVSRNHAAAEKKPGPGLFGSRWHAGTHAGLCSTNGNSLLHPAFVAAPSIRHGTGRRGREPHHRHKECGVCSSGGGRCRLLQVRTCGEGRGFVRKCIYPHPPTHPPQSTTFTPTHGI